MKNKGNSRIFARITALAAALMLLAGCGAKTENWAYDYEPEKTILSLSDNGKAVYNGESYTYTKDGDILHLKAKDGTVTDVRFVPDGENRILYQRSTYHYDGEGTPEGLTGVWKQDNGWLFEFTADGQFCEEGYFYGRFAVDEDAGIIKLMYSDPIPDAILYYSLNGSDLTVDYPWPLVRTKKG